MDSRIRVVSVGMYILAGVMLIVGVWMALGFMGAPAALVTFRVLLPNPAFSPVIDMVGRTLQSLGIALLMLSLFLSLLMVACGLLLRRSAVLSQRVARLEAALGQTALATAGPQEGSTL